MYYRLLEKIAEQRKALGGCVFDVLGKLFQEKSLRELLIEAVRYGEQPEVRERLFRVVDAALDREHLERLLEERALARETLDAAAIRRIREDMERVEARRLQPHFIASFFIEAFRLLGARFGNGSRAATRSRTYPRSCATAIGRLARTSPSCPDTSA